MKYLILALLLPVTAFAEQTEIQKIEARLEELKVIWKEDQGVINAYTKNRTQAVREGSKEYYACLDASKRIQQMEKEATELKSKKKALEESKTLAVSPVSNSVQEIRSFDLVSVKAKADSKKSETLVFKGFYLGMPASDALGLINGQLNLKQSSDTPVAVTKQELQSLYSKALADALKGEEVDTKRPFQIYKTEEVTFIANLNDLENPFALIDSDLKVAEFRLTPQVCSILFESGETPLPEFVETFSKAYGIPSMDHELLTIKSFNNDIGSQFYFIHRSPKGFEVTIWDERSIFASGADNAFMAKGQGAAKGSVFIKKIQTETERNKKFD